MTVLATTVATPWGDLALLAEDDELVAAGFADPDVMHARLRNVGPLRVVASLPRLADPVAAYVAGDVDALADVPVRQPGGAFRQAVWKALREVPAGEVVTYGELAGMAGNPLAARAAGTACAVNLVAPVVPCHRAVRRGAGLGGYYYGTSIKEQLLAHERLSSGR